MAVNTTGIKTDVGCANPISLSLTTSDPRNFSVTATSVDGCNLGPATFDPTSAEQLYGVQPVPGCDGAPADPRFQPLFWWYYSLGANGAHNARGVFCVPRLHLFDVTAFAFLNNGSLTNVSTINDYPKPNNVTGAPLNGLPYNG